MKTKNYILLIAIVLLALSSCKKSNIDNTVQATGPNPSGIYAVGFVAQDQTHRTTYATIWKNGIGAMLSTNLSVAQSITIKGTDVYVAGYVKPGSLRGACYWKNGIIVGLADSNNGSEASNILIDGEDIYVSGIVASSAAYWKNGVYTLLPSPPLTTGYARTTGIVILGKDIYISGYYLSANGLTTACYWKNGVLTSFTDYGLDSKTFGIAVNEDDVYIVGYTSGTNSLRRPAYWKNGSVNILPGGDGAFATGIFINGSDIYISGEGQTALYWKNGSLNNTIAYDSFAVQHSTGITTQKNDVIIGGCYSTSNKDVASYWKNGTPISLSLPSNFSGPITSQTSSYLTGIAIVQ